MKKGFLFYTPGGIFFIETDRRKDDTTARAALDFIGTALKSNPETLERAKRDRGTLDDIKKRLKRYTMTDTGTRYTFKSPAGDVLDIPHGVPGYYVLTTDNASRPETATA